MEFSPEEMGHLNSNSLYQTLGILVDEVKEGKARSRLQPNPALCWPFEGQPHGGILFTLMDTTMVWAVLTMIDKGYTCATINLDIQFIKPAKSDAFTCRASVTDQGKQIVYARGDIFNESGQLLSAGQGVFRIVKGSFSIG